MNSYRKSSITILFTVALLTGLVSVTFKQSTFAFSIDFSRLPGFGDSQGLNFFKGLKEDTGAQGPPGQGIQFGHLIVIKHVDNTGCTSNWMNVSDFIIHVNGNNQSPDTFHGSETGTNVTLGPGNYEIRETPSDYKMELDDGCSGVIHAGETKTCILTNTFVG